MMLCPQAEEVRAIRKTRTVRMARRLQLVTKNCKRKLSALGCSEKNNFYTAFSTPSQTISVLKMEELSDASG
jgi:hypothetical protein